MKNDDIRTAPPSEAEETRRHLAYLDGWRGLAILFVLVGHFWLDEIVPGVSVLGVTLFFVLSGRLMAEILFVQEVPLPSFFARRFSRVYPGLLFFVLAVTLIFAGTGYRQGIVAVVSALTFTLNYAMIYGHPVALLDHLWSLCVEEHGYVLLALLALFMRARKWDASSSILALGLLALANGLVQSVVLGKDYFSVFWRTDVQIAPLFVSAGLYLKNRAAADTGPRWIAPITLALGCATALQAGNVWASFGLATGLLAVSINTIDRAVVLQRVLENMIFRRLGLWSYSIYLWQQPFYKLAHAYPEIKLVLLGGALCAGLFSFYVVEQPSRRFLNRRWAKYNPRALARAA